MFFYWNFVFIECDSNENFEKFLKQALLTVTRYMDTRYLIQTTFYVDTIISLSKRANNRKPKMFLLYFKTMINTKKFY